MYQIENLGFELVSDGDLELLLDNADDANTIDQIRCHSPSTVLEINREGRAK